MGKARLGPGQGLDARYEGGVLSVLEAGGTHYSLEPGGQVEISLPPYVQALQVGEELVKQVGELQQELEDSAYEAIFLGHQPFSMPDDIELRGKPRYAIMDRRFRRVGKLGPHMMRATAGMQVTLDFRDEHECMEFLRASLIMAPFLTALYANSPLVGGKDSGYGSFRERSWWDTDPSRCGVPTRLLAADSTIRDYVDYALDAECWFRNEDGGLSETEPGLSFRNNLDAGLPLTLDDFDLQCSTLFPAARLRGGVEIRSADCVPPEMASAFCAINAGCLYDEESRGLVQELHAIREEDGIRALHLLAARDGLSAVHPELGSLTRLSERLVGHAEAGLGRLIAAGIYAPKTLDLLRPVKDCLDVSCSLARGALTRYLG
jgi:glutamate--cysteine ligase